MTNLTSVALGLLDGLEHRHRHVVVLAPHRVDMRIFGQEVLHHLERVVAAPVAELAVEDLDVRVLDRLLERVDALLVDRDRQALDDHDVALAVELLLDVVAGDAAELGIVAGDVKVLDRTLAQSAVDDRDEHALFLHFLDRVGEFIGIVRQHDERVDALRRQVFQRVGLRGAVRRGLHDHLEPRILLLERFRLFRRMKHDAAGPAVIGGGYGHRHRQLFLRFSRPDHQAEGRNARQYRFHRFTPFASRDRRRRRRISIPPHRRSRLRCASIAMMMIAP